MNSTRTGHSGWARLLGSVLVSVSLGWAPSVASAQQDLAVQAAKAPLLGGIDEIIEKAITADEIPGAVLLVGHKDRIVYRKAYGARAIVPEREEMTVDTIFDLASLTKVIATTSSVMKLVEQGKVRLNDPIARYIPEFAAGRQGETRSGKEGKDQVTVRHLFTHMAGLPPIPRVAEGTTGTDAVLQAIYRDPLVAPPGARFLYSDSSFILLGELVHRLSGMTLGEFAAWEIFRPLGMKNTRFLPPGDWIPRIAPTEEIDLPPGAKAGSGRGRILRGTVHDPRARMMGGIAGHAGLFSTADDLAIFCRMLLAGGVGPGGKRILPSATVEKMTSPQTPPWSPTLRGLGWDIDSAYSAPRGDLFPIGSFGHTGFTGTSLWLDPTSDTFVILLANSVHPYGRAAISSLRSRIATAVAAEAGVGPGRRSISVAEAHTATAENGSQPKAQDREGSAHTPRWAALETSILERSLAAGRAPARNGHTQTGIDVLASEKFASLRGKNIGLITNHSGLDREGHSTVDLLAHAPEVKLVALFSPEHGITGRLDDKVPSATDPATGLPIYSLYGETRRPTEEMLEGVDALVFDVQDAGVRFYTYITTMAYAMEEAAKRQIAFYVLDRPNPLGGEALEGPMLDDDRVNFVGYFPMPVRYAMTVGELAEMFNAENKIGCDLHVIAMQDWTRHDWYEATGLPWVPPSPNLRTLNTTLLYPGIEPLESADVSVGRGTDTPFEMFGAPWIRGVELAEFLNRRFVPAVRFVPTRFTPSAGVHKKQLCEGATVIVTDRLSLNSMLMGLEVAAALGKLYPEHFDIGRMITLLGSREVIARLKHGDLPAIILADGTEELEKFKTIRAKYLLYR